MWIWDQSAGTLSRNDRVVSRGYSGKGRGKNCPTLQNVPGIGPIPRGEWIIGPPYKSSNVGPYCLTLKSRDNTIDDIDEETGRSCFRIHGDSIRAPGTASKGCIILPRIARAEIWESGDRLLLVVE